MKKSLIILLSMLTLILNFAYASGYEEMNADISPEEGFKGNPPDFYSSDKEINYYHELDENNNIIYSEDEEVKGSPLPSEGGQPVGPDAYIQDKMYYVAEGIRGFNKQLDIPMYLQKNSDFGGPAVVEMIVDYFEGPINKQEIYADYMGTNSFGTDLEMVKKAINNYQNKKEYNIIQIDSKYHFMNCLIEALEDNRPMIADISTSREYKNNDWIYDMPGHYVLISGCKVTVDDETIITIFDPYMIGKKEVGLDQLYRMLEAHHARSIVY